MKGHISMSDTSAEMQEFWVQTEPQSAAGDTDLIKSLMALREMRIMAPDATAAQARARKIIEAIPAVNAATVRVVGS